jgi:hypothetical protein
MKGSTHVILTNNDILTKLSLWFVRNDVNPDSSTEWRIGRVITIIDVNPRCNRSFSVDQCRIVGVMPSALFLPGVLGSLTLRALSIRLFLSSTCTIPMHKPGVVIGHSNDRFVPMAKGPCSKGTMGSSSRFLTLVGYVQCPNDQ